jgi:hypothetical protein
MNKIWKYLGSIVKSDSPDSSKRFLALLTFALVIYVVIRFTGSKNYVTVLEILLGFVCVMLGVAVWQDIRKTRIDKEKNEGSN